MIDNAVFPRYAYVGIVRVKVMGHVEESDLIGAFFHDTKNVLKGKLDLQKLSEEQKIGRISVKKRYERGASFFECKLLFALDKQEVAFVLAALESIEKVAHSPCSVRVFSLGECEPEREKKIRTRALELEKTFFGNEDKKELKSSAPVFSYDRGAIFSGPRLAQAEEIILVEGRADVRKLLSFGMENVLSVNGGHISPKIISLCKDKMVTVFLDGDRAGRLVFESLKEIVPLHYVCFAPRGRSVEDLSFDEVAQCLMNKKKFLHRKDFSQSDERKMRTSFPRRTARTETGRENNSFQERRSFGREKEAFPQKTHFDRVQDRERVLFQALSFRPCVEKIAGKSEFVLANLKGEVSVHGHVRDILRADVASFKSPVLVVDGVYEGSLSKKINGSGVKHVLCKKVGNYVRDPRVRVHSFDEMLM